MTLTDMEIVAEVWVDADGENGEDLGNLERCVLEIERSDLDEVHLMVRGIDDERTHVYVARDRALRLGHALIESALKEWDL